MKLPDEMEWCLAYDMAMGVAGRHTVSKETIQALWEVLPADDRISIYNSCCEIIKAGPLPTEHL